MNIRAGILILLFSVHTHTKIIFRMYDSCSNETHSEFVLGEGIELIKNGPLDVEALSQ
jgi:hypothetical protein